MILSLMNAYANAIKFLKPWESCSSMKIFIPVISFSRRQFIESQAYLKALMLAKTVHRTKKKKILKSIINSILCYEFYSDCQIEEDTFWNQTLRNSAMSGKEEKSITGFYLLVSYPYEEEYISVIIPLKESRFRWSLFLFPTKINFPNFRNSQAQQEVKGVSTLLLKSLVSLCKN